MAGRGPRTGNEEAADDAGQPWDEALVRVCDLAGRPRGTGFAADHHGTVITSHEAVDGLARLVLHTSDDRTCVVTDDAVTPLPDAGLALVRTEGLGLGPLPVTVRDRVETGTYVRIAAGGWREARVLGSSTVTYTATDRFHVLGDAMELAIGTAGADALRLGGGAAGGPVLDAGTGAVVAVVGTALLPRALDGTAPGETPAGHRAPGFAVPLRGVAGPLADLLARNAATVPAYGADLNLAGALELTATSVGSDGPRPPAPAGSAGTAPGPVERAEFIREFTAFERGPAAVLGLVGPPGSGRTTELAALAARRLRGPEPAPTLWLRGADLLADDGSVADAAARALERAGRIVAASRQSPGERGGEAARRPADADVLPPRGYGGELGDIGPDRLARLARALGRPLLLLLDGPEEMPPELAHRLPAWTGGTAAWLGETGARLVVGCRAEHWERAGAGFPAELLHRPAGPSSAYPGEQLSPDAEGALPACVRLGDLTEEEALRARSWAGIPEGVLAPADARHPLMLRLLSEVRATLPDAPAEPLGRDDVFAAHLDLMCLRVAVRLAAANGLRGTAVRRLAARVSGQVHEAARRCLGPGQGELDRASFEAVFPWGPAPGRRLAGITGWASAVLAEGLLVPAGDGYRFAHEELADWIQGTHLDLDAALHSLVHRRRAAPDPDSDGTGTAASSRRQARRSRSTAPDSAADILPVPRHRIGPVVETLLLLARQQGTTELTLRLEDLVHAVDELLPPAQDPLGDRLGDPLWWAGHLCSTVLLRVPDATPYIGVLRLLTERIVAWREQGRAVPAEFGPAFWAALPVPDTERFDLLRRLVTADPRRVPGAEPPRPGEASTAPRYLDTVARLLAADPVAVHRHLTRWFDDERPLPATPHATVATAAQALLYAHRRRALDDLAEALVACAHRRGDELLAVLAEEEPSAVCRAVDRWAHDEQPARRVAAVAYGLRAAPFVGTRADRELLRYAAFALLARPADCTLHGGALGILVRDPLTRARYLPQALERFADGDPRLPPSAPAAALTTHTEPVLAAFRDRLRRPGPDTAELLRTLADATTPALARRVAAAMREAVELCPGAAADLAAYVDRRLDHGSATDAVLFLLVSGLLEGCSTALRAALAQVLAAPGGKASAPPRRELLDLLLAHERDPVVLDTVLRAAADGADRRGEEPTRELVHRVGLLLVRTPAGATGFDRGLVDLARRVPGFAALVARWLTDTPEEWSCVVGPSTRRMIENLAGAGVPA
ncbi:MULTISPECIES: trypsin-like peptidase domain-containing protein [unclassified Streptomyces]|uniref:trypsin-like peptidase domain-containing protein n=1 Tax=unclassified Streptomyces TaxID=2593676 RepID=UPI00224F8C6D|nr:MULTISPECIES: trypsin-like peptidase domain-containing protein [unclassified Streptomyces]MCX4988066.1 serine protease [Streptomyces sp. NBC_00568]MCX5006802.1 serine protease [Streptomyces sp. NBC_00638]